METVLQEENAGLRLELEELRRQFLQAKHQVRIVA